MLPTDMPLSHLGPMVLLLLLPFASAFFPNIWSLLAVPGSITHQDPTEEAALSATLQLFLEQPPSGRPSLHLKVFLVRVPAGFPHLLGPPLPEVPCQGNEFPFLLPFLPTAATTPRALVLI